MSIILCDMSPRLPLHSPLLLGERNQGNFHGLSHGACLAQTLPNSCSTGFLPAHFQNKAEWGGFHPIRLS